MRLRSTSEWLQWQGVEGHGAAGQEVGPVPFSAPPTRRTGMRGRRRERGWSRVPVGVGVGKIRHAPSSVLYQYLAQISADGSLEIWSTRPIKIWLAAFLALGLHARLPPFTFVCPPDKGHHGQPTPRTEPEPRVRDESLPLLQGDSIAFKGQLASLHTRCLLCCPSAVH